MHPDPEGDYMNAVIVDYKLQIQALVASLRDMTPTPAANRPMIPEHSLKLARAQSLLRKYEDIPHGR